MRTRTRDRRGRAVGDPAARRGAADANVRLDGRASTSGSTRATCSSRACHSRRGRAPSAAKQQFYSTALERIRTIPGVQSASVSSSAPPFGGFRSGLVIPGDRLTGEFERERIFLLRGVRREPSACASWRDGLSANDVASARKVALINETLATRYSAGRVRSAGRSGSQNGRASLGRHRSGFEVIGIVQDVREPGRHASGATRRRICRLRCRRAEFQLMVRTASEPMAIAEPVRRELRRLDGGSPSADPSRRERCWPDVSARPRFNALVLGIFAGTGLVLVTLGIYGVVAYTVSQQTRQIAIRMALGGERRHVLRMVLRGGLTPVAIGLVAGVGGRCADQPAARDRAVARDALRPRHDRDHDRARCRDRRLRLLRAGLARDACRTRRRAPAGMNRAGQRTPGGSSMIRMLRKWISAPSDSRHR